MGAKAIKLGSCDKHPAHFWNLICLLSPSYVGVVNRPATITIEKFKSTDSYFIFYVRSAYVAAVSF